MAKAILVIDDETGYREPLQMDLSEQGFSVFAAEGGPQALEILKREKIDLVVTDMKMPKMDGFETVAAIRKLHPALPIVLMTGYAMEDRVQKALELTASLCLKKPFEIAELTTAIRAALPS